ENDTAFGRSSSGKSFGRAQIHFFDGIREEATTEAHDIHSDGQHTCLWPQAHGNHEDQGPHEVGDGPTDGDESTACKVNGGAVRYFGPQAPLAASSRLHR